MWATIIGVGGGLLGVGILIWQAILTRKAANAAKASADGLISSERAWVVVEEAYFKDMKENKWVTRPKIKNLGKTIARIRKVSLGGALVRRTEKLPDSPAYSESRDFDFVLCPNQEFPEDELTYILIDHENVRNAHTGLFSMYLYGLVEYLDLAGRERATGFVLIYSPGYHPQGFLPYLSAPTAYYKTT